MRTLRTVATVSGALLVVGCGAPPEKNSSASEAAEYGTTIDLADDFDSEGHFNWGYAAAPSNWDPSQSASGGDGNFYEPVYDRLLSYQADGTIVGMLATDFEASEDGLTLTLTLREGLEFSDGTAFDADAVKFNLDRNRSADSRLAGDLHQVESVEVVDEYTLDIHVTGAIGALPTALSSRAGMMVSPAAVEAGTLESEPVGIGAYLTTEFVPGAKVEYVVSPDYWDPEAQRVASMTYYYMPDDQTRINALKSGEIDGANIRPTDFGPLADAGLTPIVQASGQYVYIAVNTSKEPFGDPNVRKAINMAIDREGISEGIYDGYCTPQIQPFAESGPGYSEKIGDGLDIFGYDPAEAKDLMDAAGVDEPIEITMMTPSVTVYTKIAEVVQAQLSEIGISAKIDPVPPAELVQSFALEQTAESMVSISTSINDPDVVNSRTLAPGALCNPGKAEYPELIKWGDEGAASLDADERAPAYEKYMDAWVESPPHLIPICMVHAASAYAAHVSGVQQSVTGGPNLRGVAISAA